MLKVNIYTWIPRMHIRRGYSGQQLQGKTRVLALRLSSANGECHYQSPPQGIKSNTKGDSGRDVRVRAPCSEECPRQYMTTAFSVFGRVTDLHGSKGKSEQYCSILNQGDKAPLQSVLTPCVSVYNIRACMQVSFRQEKLFNESTSFLGRSAVDRVAKYSWRIWN